jgi:hypothetical protein
MPGAFLDAIYDLNVGPWKGARRRSENNRPAFRVLTTAAIEGFTDRETFSRYTHKIIYRCRILDYSMFT